MKRAAPKPLTDERFHEILRSLTDEIFRYTKHTVATDQRPTPWTPLRPP